MSDHATRERTGAALRQSRLSAFNILDDHGNVPPGGLAGLALDTKAGIEALGYKPFAEAEKAAKEIYRERSGDHAALLGAGRVMESRHRTNRR